MTASPITRVRVFIDYWNFQLSLNEIEAEDRGLSDYRFEVDWKAAGPWLARLACETAGIPVENHSFDGVSIYTSYNPSTDEGKKYHNWTKTWLNKQPGVQVECRERKVKRPPRCPACHQDIVDCPLCKKKIVATVEKGVDTLIATDMIRLAWENGYDMAVLATLDSDLIPAVEFLNAKALKVIQAGFPPKGVDLANACWASFDIARRRAEIARPGKSKT